MGRCSKGNSGYKNGDECLLSSYLSEPVSRISLSPFAPYLSCCEKDNKRDNDEEEGRREEDG